MSMHELKLHKSANIEQGQNYTSGPRRRGFVTRWLPSVLFAFAAIMLPALPARAQPTPTPTPTPAPLSPCPPALAGGQILFKVPEIVSKEGKLRGTIVLGDEQEWMAFRVPVAAATNQSRSQCFPQYVRTFREYGAVPTLASTSAGNYPVPRPGPTLRARVGDLVQLTFINQINPANFGDSIDRGETGRGGGCDESSGGGATGTGYPGMDKYPDCFHGSSTGNIHFHGTHTNPNTTGDNVFIEVRPSVRVNKKPIVTPESVEKSFNQFFALCEAQLNSSVFRSNLLKEWPKTWSDLPKSWTDEQKWLLNLYDTQMQTNYGSGVRKLWPVDEAQLKEGAWPQYYVGAFPYCFRLPEYVEKSWPPPKPSPMQMGGAGTAEMQMGTDPLAQAEGDRVLMMGQAPGTHWYHAHKHGSTAINVANGMTGAFIIEGQYDDDLNMWYGTGWTRTQPVLVINQLGVSPNLMRGKASRLDRGPDLSVNGQLKPVIKMQPGEVQMWRIVNTSGRAGAYFPGPPAGFEWKQLAQDGVQFNNTNYQNNHNDDFLMAAGNRVDLLVKAPASPCAIRGGCPYQVQVQNEIDPSELSPANQVTLFTVMVSGTPIPSTAKGAQFIPNAPGFPPFLADISNAEVKGTKRMVFSSTGPGKGGMHLIDGKKFDGEVGAVVLLNQAEEWKIVNETFGPLISHPFHIHINPFQVVEVFSPNDNGSKDSRQNDPEIHFRPDGPRITGAVLS